MKNLFLSISMIVLCANFINAQDIIISHKGEKIEAKIMEISEDAVKYKNFNNQGGPVFIMSTDEISTILFQNGDTKVFSKKQVEEENITSFSKHENNYLVTTDDGWAFNDIVITSRKEYENFLRNNCMEAYKKYKNGKTLVKTGWGLFGGGLGLQLIGALIYYNVDATTGFAINSLGGACFLAGIPTFSVGYARKKGARATFNSKCADKNNIAMNVGISNNGLGLFITF